jgi:hypothetical protein
MTEHKQRVHYDIKRTGINLWHVSGTFERSHWVPLGPSPFKFQGGYTEGGALVCKPHEELMLYGEHAGGLACALSCVEGIREFWITEDSFIAFLEHESPMAALSEKLASLWQLLDVRYVVEWCHDERRHLRPAGV